MPPARVLYRALDVTALLRPGALHQVTVSLGMCKYGALGNTGAGVFCVGAHATTAACRAALVKVSVEFEEAAPREFVTSASSGAWAATTAGNPTVYTHLFHGEQYDSRRLGAGPEVWGPATAYDTAAHQQVGLGALSLHAVTEEVPAVSVRRVCQGPAVGRLPRACPTGWGEGEGAEWGVRCTVFRQQKKSHETFFSNKNSFQHKILPLVPSAGECRYGIAHTANNTVWNVKNRIVRNACKLFQ